MAISLKQKGCGIIVCADKKGPLFAKALDAGLNCHPVSIKAIEMLNPFKINCLKRIFKNNKVQHLILNLPTDLKVAGLAAKQAAVPNIIYRRGSAIPIKNSFLNAYLFKNIVHRIIANSEETSRTILANNPKLFRKDNIFVLYNGIDFHDFPDAAEIRKTPSKSMVLGAMGRLVPQKNQMFFIPLMEELKRRNLPIQLHIAGEGSLNALLQNEIIKHGLQNEMRLIGFQSKEFLKNCDLFVHASLWEGFGYVLVEAQAYGLPVVAFNNSSNPEVVRDGETAILVPENDVQAFADAVEDFYNHPEKRQKFGQHAMRWSRKTFRLEESSNKLIRFLSED